MAVITISRQFGSGGRTLGKMIADTLDYTFADNEIIQMIAREANVSAHFVASVEKEAGTKLSRVISSMVSMKWVDRILSHEHGYIDEQIYLDYLVLMVAQIADEDNVVILGRGSQYILDDLPGAYHILLIDSLENRIRFMMKNYDLPRKRAAAIVNNEDKRRVNLYKKLGKTDYDDPALYHMVLNMSRLNLAEAKRLILSLVKP